jgi:hypothetical protein
MRIFALSLAFLVAGCATTAYIGDLKSDEVIVNGSGPDMSIIDAKARMGCAAHDKTASAVISSTCVDQNCIRKRYLYACQ